MNDAAPNRCRHCRAPIARPSLFCTPGCAKDRRALWAHWARARAARNRRSAVRACRHCGARMVIGGADGLHANTRYCSENCSRVARNARSRARHNAKRVAAQQEVSP